MEKGSGDRVSGPSDSKRWGCGGRTSKGARGVSHQVEGKAERAAAEVARGRSPGTRGGCSGWALEGDRGDCLSCRLFKARRAEAAMAVASAAGRAWHG